MEFEKLYNIGIKAALAAGKIIQKYRNEAVIVEQKSVGTSQFSQVVTEVDKASENVILSHLLSTCKAHNLALLSEETEDDESRFEKDFFWCIDPMDGTFSFINNQPGFSVSIALVSKDGTPCIGIVFDPSTNNIYSAMKGQGAFKNNAPWIIEHSNTHLTYVTDRKLKDTPQANKINKLLHEKVNNMNLTGIKELSGEGAVMNAIFVLEKGPACMMKLPKKENGGGSIWDFAATACIYNALSLPATNFKGGRLDLNRKDGTFMNHEGVYFENLRVKN